MRVPSTHGVEVAVHELGGEGPPLLLCHATGFHGLVWLPVATRLAPRFSSLALDFRGHGDSTAPDDGAFTWDRFAADVLAVVDHLGLRRPFGVGHSKGATALLLAEEERPGTFAALYCYEPVMAPDGSSPSPAADRLSEGARRRRSTFASREEAYAHLAAKPPLAALDPEALWAYVEHGLADRPDGSVSLKCQPDHEARTYAEGLRHRAWARLGRVACPVVVACGERTDAFGPAVIERVAAALPRGRAEVLAGLGHFGPLEDPAAMATSVLEAFVAAVPPHDA